MIPITIVKKNFPKMQVVRLLKVKQNKKEMFLYVFICR